MTPQQFDHVQQVFLRLRSATEQQRGSELALEDEIIRTEVLSLLAADESCGTFLEHEQGSADREFPTVIMQPPEPNLRPPKRVGRYRLLQQIGEGGHGTVFMAEQKEPIDRKVAVKLIKPGMDSKQVLARFHAERQALAMMDHPSIARVIDAGTTETGSPYFVMELVKGVPIHEFCEQNDLNLDERLEIFLQVCNAVHHAHQKGVIHRDLKPSNVLVTMAEDKPLAKVIDFGIAKALDTRLTQETLFTEYGQMIGTLEYMSPEQAEMSAVDIDTRSDVYSLGVLLYQLLTGETPIGKDELLRKGVFEIPRLIRETEPVTPSSRITTRQRQLSRVERESSGLLHLQGGDLDWIAMKALAKDRRLRYDSAIDFARDIQRYLAGDPVQAHPPSYTYQLAKFARRHRVVAITGLIVAMSFLVGIVGLVVGLQQASSALSQANQDRNAAVAAKQQLAENMYTELLQSAWRATKEHDNGRAIRLLDSCLPELRGWEWEFARSQIHDQAHTVLRSAGQSSIETINLDASSNQAACILENGNVEIWNLQDDQVSRTIDGEFQANAACFSANAKELVIGTASGELVVFHSPDWKRASSKNLGLGGIYDLTISSDGRRIATCTGGAFVEVFDLKSLDSVSKWKLPARTSSLCFLDDGENIIATGLDGIMYSLQLGDPNVQGSFVSEASLGRMTKLSDNAIAVLSSGMAIKIDIRSPGNSPAVIVRCQGAAAAIAIDDAGVTAVGCSDGSLVLRRPSEEQHVVANFGTAIRALAASNTEQTFLVALSDGRLLRVNSQESNAGWFAESRTPITTGVLLPATGLAISFDEDGWMRAFDIETGELQTEVRAHPKPVWSAACDEKERLLTTVGEDQRIRCWELPSFKLRFERDIAWGVRDVCVAPDASWIAAAPPASNGEFVQQEGTIGIWNAQTGNCDRLLKGHDNWVLKLAVTPDGSRLVSASENRNTRIWNFKNGETLCVISPLKQSPAEHIAFDHSAKHVFLGHRDGWVTSWNLQDGLPIGTWAAFGDSITGVHVTNDDRVVATSRSSEQLRVRNPVTGQTLAEFDLGIGYVLSSQFSNDTTFMSAAGQDRRVLTTRVSGVGID